MSDSDRSDSIKDRYESINSEFEGGQSVGYSVEPGISSDNCLQSNRDGLLSDGSFVGSKSLSFARIQNNHCIASIVVEDLGPIFFNCCVQPHKFVLCSSLNLAVILRVQGFELILQLLSRRTVGNQNHTESSLGAQADVFGTFVMKFWENFSHPLFGGA